VVDLDVRVVDRLQIERFTDRMSEHPDAPPLLMGASQIASNRRIDDRVPGMARLEVCLCGLEPCTRGGGEPHVRVALDRLDALEVGLGGIGAAESVDRP